MISRPGRLHSSIRPGRDPYLEKDLGYVGGACPHFGAQYFGFYLLNIGSDGLKQGPIGWRASFFVAPAPEDLCALLFGMGAQLASGSGLADTRFPGEHYDAASASQRVIQGRL